MEIRLKKINKTILSFVFFVQCMIGFQLSAQLLHVTDHNKDALDYVGNVRPENGQMQLELLQRENLQEKDYVLEIGCGALVAGIPIMSFLEKGHYVGIDPNKWLIDASLHDNENKLIVDNKSPLFLYNENFDAHEVGISFDYILAHSIMSHAPLWQLRLFLQRCSEVLKDNGKVVFSIRLTEANAWDGLGIKQESTTTEWQYPGNTFFHEETVIAEALKWFKKVERKPLYTQLIMSADYWHFHEWFVLTK